VDEYLLGLERALHLSREQTRAILTEVRSGIEDLTAHLQAQGHGSDEAERLALQHFGSARSLARSLRRAHGQAPLPLRLLALPLLVAGLGGLAIVAIIARSLLWVVMHDGEISPNLYWLDPRNITSFQALQDWLHQFIPAFILAGIAASSLLLAAIVLRGGRRRWRLIAAGVCLLSVLDAAGSWRAYWPYLAPQALQVPTSPYLPNLKPYADAGLVSRPGPDEPSSPVRVDYVAEAMGATYVVYSLPDPLQSGEIWNLRLFDEHGTEYERTGGPSSVWDGLNGVQALLPWRPAIQGVQRFAPLPPGTHAVMIRFERVVWHCVWTGGCAAQGDAVPSSEVVHVPQHLQALAEVRSALPAITSRVLGITLTVESVSNSPFAAWLSYRVSWPSGWPMVNPSDVTVTDSRGHAYSEPIDVTWGGLNHASWCTAMVPIAARPRGSRVTLALQGLAESSNGRLYRGTWRATIPMP